MAACEGLKQAETGPRMLESPCVWIVTSSGSLRGVTEAVDKGLARGERLQKALSGVIRQVQVQFTSKENKPEAQMLKRN